MQSYVSATFQSLDCAGGVCVVDGYGVQVRVRNRCLIVSDGIGRFRRERRFAKALGGIKRLVVISHEGAITLEALRWLNDAGIAFLQIDRDGEVIAASANYGLNDPRLRRALALAPTKTTGLEIARYVLHAKLAGQEMNLARPIFPENAPAELTIFRNIAENAASISEMLTAEAKGALAYWGAWKDVSLRFARKDEKSIPEYWRTFGQRRSPITDSPRSAANPANAMLNYLYALLEAETRFACLACGLDPGLGIFHADQKARDSLALDLMEAVRPQVDAYLLDLIERRTFTGKDFVETRKGVCRVLAPLTHTLAETTPLWAKAVAPVVENVAALLVSGGNRQLSLPTPLTQSNRSAGRDGVRRNPKRSAPTPAKPAPTCATCGGPLPGVDRLFCDDCLPEERRQHNARFSAAGVDGLARMRAEGRDPMDSEGARRKLGDANAKRRREEVEWDRAHEKPDPGIFTREILPLLQTVTLPQMRAATGLSGSMCARIRRGYVPHPRHWSALRGC
jgi:CRISPR-associated endonuclease Cas1